MSRVSRALRLSLSRSKVNVPVTRLYAAAARLSMFQAPAAQAPRTYYLELFFFDRAVTSPPRVTTSARHAAPANQFSFRQLHYAQSEYFAFAQNYSLFYSSNDNNLHAFLLFLSFLSSSIMQIDLIGPFYLPIVWQCIHSCPLDPLEFLVSKAWKLARNPTLWPDEAQSGHPHPGHWHLH